MIIPAYLFRVLMPSMPPNAPITKQMSKKTSVCVDKRVSKPRKEMSVTSMPYVSPSDPPRYQPLTPARLAVTTPPIHTEIPWIKYTYTGNDSSFKPVNASSKESKIVDIQATSIA